MELGAYTATQEFHAESDTELALRIGDKVFVTTLDESQQWAYGNIGDIAGWFPFNHVSKDEENYPATARQPPPPVTARQPSPSVAPKPTNNNRKSSFSQNLSNLEQLLGGVQIPNNVKETPRRRTSDIVPPPLDQFSENHNRPAQYNNNGPSRSNYPYTEPASTGPPSEHKGNHYTSQQSPATVRPPFGGPQGNGFPPQSPSSRFGGVSNQNSGSPNPTLPSSAPPRFTFPNNSGRRVSQGRIFTFQFCVEALHPYTKQSQDQLTFAAREKLDIMESPSPDDDWWFARNKAGEMGVVPKNYVKQKQQSTPVLAERLWYKYRISRDETEHQMRSKPVESYVIRDSEAFVSNPFLDMTDS